MAGGTFLLESMGVSIERRRRSLWIAWSIFGISVIAGSAIVARGLVEQPFVLFLAVVGALVGLGRLLARSGRHALSAELSERQRGDVRVDDRQIVVTHLGGRRSYARADVIQGWMEAWGGEVMVVLQMKNGD